jgi:glycosyltransferase involved in cell wall biosynthesis
MSRGSSGDDVKALQRQLNALGYRDENGNQLDEDGKFGRHTLAAVNSFKNANNLKNNTKATTGIVGDTTLLYLKNAFEVNNARSGGNYSQISAINAQFNKDINKLLALDEKGFTRLIDLANMGYDISDYDKITKMSDSAYGNVFRLSKLGYRFTDMNKIMNLDESKITTIYNTINTENINNEIDKTLVRLKTEDKFVVAQISRLVDYKGIYDFLNIARSVSKEESNIKFVLIGDGEETENIRYFIKKNEMNDVVFTLGNKDNVINQLKYIDLVLLCSYIEGLPLTPLEAFSQGVPVVATDIPGTNEEIQNGVNGYLVEMKDINGFKEKIMNIYHNKEEYIIMKKKCVKLFNEKFNSEIYFNSHLKVYKAHLRK